VREDDLTYEETILRYRVYKKRYNREDAPKNWWLMTSHSTLKDAEKYANNPDECGIGLDRDNYKVVDNGEATVVTREIW
jgi:hypothetical protein|tara:strand:+ start:63 stop:299 length:237 start_codon:yes stop_codon:yes gene_type:complete